MSLTIQAKTIQDFQIYSIFDFNDEGVVLFRFDGCHYLVTILHEI